MTFKCNRPALTCIIQLLRTLNALVLCLHALNALAQRATNTRVLLQIYRDTYECARLTVNLHASCTILNIIIDEYI